MRTLRWPGRGRTVPASVTGWRMSRSGVDRIFWVVGSAMVGGGWWQLVGKEYVDDDSTKIRTS